MFTVAEEPFSLVPETGEPLDCVRRAVELERGEVDAALVVVRGGVRFVANQR